MLPNVNLLITPDFETKNAKIILCVPKKIPKSILLIQHFLNYISHKTSLKLANADTSYSGAF